LNTLYNINRLVENSKKVKIKKIEDKWILSKFNSLIKKVTKELEELHPHLATRALQNFWLNDLSRGYIKFVRDRLSSNDKEANFILKEIYLKLIKLLAPIIPFITENIWQELIKKNIAKEESIHLSEWPKFESKFIDEKLEKEFEIALEIIEKGLAERDKEKIGLKWPLSNAIVKSKEEISEDLQEIIMNQLNIKEIKMQIGNEKEISVKLDTKFTKELEAEGYAREISRKVQATRKRAGLVKTDIIQLAVVLDEDLKKIVKFKLEFIRERTNSKEILIEKINEKKYKNSFEDKIKGKKIKILFNRV